MFWSFGSATQPPPCEGAAGVGVDVGATVTGATVVAATAVVTGIVVVTAGATVVVTGAAVVAAVPGQSQ
jgi:hypothetical protein